MTEESQQGALPEGVEIRYTQKEDASHMKKWFEDPSIQKWFPMLDDPEFEDATMRWVGFYRYNCSLTITKDGVPCGIATLYLQPYKKLAHQCEFGIIIGEGFRGMGLGSHLLHALCHLAKEKFKIEVLHLQVYSENPAISLYKRFGFKEFGRQDKWIKETSGEFTGRIFMEKEL